MTRRTRATRWTGACLLIAVITPGVPSGMAQITGADAAWTSRFDVAAGDFVSSGRGAFFVLEPGRVAEFATPDRRGRLQISVLGETRTVAGVETRIVEEREWEGDEIIEVSRNYFAVSRSTGGLFYFGEDVDTYSGGRVSGHDGSWRAGVGGARFGLALPGRPLLGARYYQEVAPGVAMDRAEVVSLTAVVETPAGTFRDALRIEETTPLEPGVKEYKVYARGVGLVQDGELRLVRVTDR
ncbi:MAG: hypothetical protein R2752_11010 [Vicinamibacterales bacterium]